MDPIFLQMLASHFLASMPSGSTVRLDGRGSVRLDLAVSTAFIAQELEFVKSQLFDVKKVALKARTFIPVSHDVNPGAEVVAYDSYDTIGEAKIVEDYAKDFPRVDAEKKRLRDTIFEIGASYGWTFQDLRAIAMSGSRLNLERAMQARRAIEAKLDKLAALGATERGGTGFVNNADVVLFGTALSWSLATSGRTIKANLNALVQKVITDSKETHIPDTLLLPPKAFAVANEVTYSDQVETSALKSFLQDSPYIRRVDQWTRLEAAGADGVKDRIVAYQMANDCMELEIPMEYEETAPEIRGKEFIVHASLRSAGTIVRRPLAMKYADGTFTPES